MAWGTLEMTTSKCAYPQCQKCTYDYCIKDAPETSDLPPNRRDRTEYDKKYYQRNKKARKAYFKIKRLQRIYPEVEPCEINYIEVYHAINKLKKKLGEDNCTLVIKQIEKCLGR